MRCPKCGEKIEKKPVQCPYCNIYLLENGETPSPTELKLDAWTQGMTTDFRSNGEFEATEYDRMPLSIALRILREMPAPPDDKVVGPNLGVGPTYEVVEGYCPPHLGFIPVFTVSCLSNDKYLIFPDNQEVSLEEAEKLVVEFYQKNQ
jgi:hypothetical protein